MTYDCDCSWDDDAPTIYRKSEHTARKEHRCCECGRTIRPGERHEYVFGIWDGRAETCSTCTHCLSIREWVVAHVPCSCWAHGSMLDDVRKDVAAYQHQAPGLAMGYLRRVAALKRARGFRRVGHEYIKEQA